MTSRGRLVCRVQSTPSVRGLKHPENPRSFGEMITAEACLRQAGLRHPKILLVGRTFLSAIYLDELWARVPMCFVG